MGTAVESGSREITDLRDSRVLALVLVCTVSFMNVLDITVVSVALGDIGQSLGGSQSELQWVVDAYTLPLGALLMSAATLSGSLGRLRLFRWGLVLFTVGSAVCALAPSMLVLNAFRALQAVGGAIFLGVGVPMISDRYAAGRERARATGIYGLISGVAIAVGPLAGGGLVLVAGWRSIFWINVPVGVVSWLASWYVKDHGADRRGSDMDWPGTLLAVLAAGGVTVVLLEGSAWGWTSARTLGGVAVGLAALGLFMAVERRSDSPMVPGRLLTDRLYVVSILTGFAVQAGLVGQMPWLSLYAQNIYLLSPLQAGLCFLPFSLCAIAGAWLFRGGNRRWAPSARLLGILVVGCAALMSWVLLYGSSTWVALLPGLILAGIAVGAAGTVVNELAVASFEGDDAGAASGLSAAMRQIGVVLGVAVSGVGFGGASEHVVRDQWPVGAQELVSSVRSGQGLRTTASAPGAGRSLLADVVHRATDWGMVTSFAIGLFIMLMVLVTGVLWLRRGGVNMPTPGKKNSPGPRNTAHPAH